METDEDTIWENFLIWFQPFIFIGDYILPVKVKDLYSCSLAVCRINLLSPYQTRRLGITAFPISLL